tara:strand:- start:127 stop:1023 length:897 start_codon:yes stop_codon:yes gene_type:complete
MLENCKSLTKNTRYDSNIKYRNSKINNQTKNADLTKFLSPINIDTSNITKVNIDIKFFYIPETPYIINKKNNIIILSDNGSYILYNNKKYILKNISFTLPSNHTIDGSTKDLEISLVHQSHDTRTMLTMSIMGGLDTNNSATNSYLNKIITYLPSSSTRINYLDIDNLNIYDVLPNNKSFYMYNSMKTGLFNNKPLFKNIQIVLKEPITISPKFYRKIQYISNFNYKLLNPVYNRTIYYSEKKTVRTLISNTNNENIRNLLISLKFIFLIILIIMIWKKLHYTYYIYFILFFIIVLLL